MTSQESESKNLFQSDLDPDETKSFIFSMSVIIGVLAVQGAFLEHLTLLNKAAAHTSLQEYSFSFVEVRTSQQLTNCQALVIPGGESTAISLVAARTDLLDTLREFVKYESTAGTATKCTDMLIGSNENRLGEPVLD